jgi:hypothetical protein
MGADARLVAPVRRIELYDYADDTLASEMRSGQVTWS